MIQLALLFLLISLLALLGGASQLAWIFFDIGEVLLLAVLSFFLGDQLSHRFTLKKSQRLDNKNINSKVNRPKHI